MNNHATFVACSSSVEENGYFQSASGAAVTVQLESELSRVFCLDAVCNIDGILKVSSATAVVDKDVVRSSFCASHFDRSG